MTATETVQENGVATGPQRPSNVIEALAAVRRDLPGIGKNMEASAQQGGYSYRGIEDITAAAGPLLGKHCVVFAPEVTEERVVDLVVNNKPWTDTRLKVVYRVYGPGGIDDCLVIGPLLAVGRDNSDKGANKCMTQAYKVALLQALCIGDSKDDVDGQTHEADAAETADPDRWARDHGWDDQAAHDAFRAVTVEVRNALHPDDRDTFKAWCQLNDHAMNRHNPWLEAEALRKQVEMLRDTREASAEEPEDAAYVALQQRYGALLPKHRKRADKLASRVQLSTIETAVDQGEQASWSKLLDAVETEAQIAEHQAISEAT